MIVTVCRFVYYQAKLEIILQPYLFLTFCLQSMPRLLQKYDKYNANLS